MSQVKPEVSAEINAANKADKIAIVKNIGKGILGVLAIVGAVTLVRKGIEEWDAFDNTSIVVPE